MCGIFAVSGLGSAANVVLFGLRDLEYRGYDSWGVGVISKGKVLLEKHEGKIKAKKSNLPNTTVAFGHTRWATHGGVTEKNAHPHLDCAGRIGVVHNGIVENFEDLKASLINEGHKFKSQTDTEVIPHLIEKFQRQGFDFDVSVRKSFGELKGFCAIVAIDSGTGELVAIRRGSPLVVGIGPESVCLASDALSIAPITRKVVYLPDEILVRIREKAEFFDLGGKKVIPVVEQLDEDIVPASRGKFKHFMLKEIHDQLKVLETAEASMMTSVRLLAESIQKKKDLVIMGCGSAYYASLFGSYLLSLTCKHKSMAIPANEYKYAKWLGDNEFTLFVSQSGETIDVLEALEESKRLKAGSGALVNVIGSSLSRRVDSYVPLSSGPEIGVATTKVFTAMLAAFYLLSSTISGSSKKDRKMLLSQATKASKEIISDTYQRKFLAPVINKLARSEHIYILGKNLLYPIALEASLKLKEVVYIHAEGFASGELKHGMIALIEKGTPCILFVPEDETKADVLSAAAEVKARGAFVIGIGPSKNAIFDAYLPTKDLGVLSAIPMIITIQLLAYKLACRRKLDPDKPRNLAKSVTVK